MAIENLEIKTQSRSAVSDDGKEGAKSESKAPRIVLNQNATAAYTQLIKSRQDELPVNVALSLNKLSTALSQAPAEAPADEIQPEGSSKGTYTQLSVQLIERDEKLKEQVAQNLSSGRRLVRQRDAAAEFERNVENLPPPLQESQAGGKALAKFICEDLACLTDPNNLGAGLERGLAVNSVYVPEDKLSPRARAAAGDALTASLAYIKSNQPQVLSELEAAAAKAAQEAEQASPAAAAQTSEGGSAGQTQDGSKAASGAVQGSTLPENLSENTYLDIFKQHKQIETAAEPDEVSAQMSERIKGLINKAAEAAKRSHLLADEKTLSENKAKAGESAAPSSGRTAADVDAEAQGNSGANKAEAHVKDGPSLAELSARAAKLQQQFREDRARLAAAGKLPDPAEPPQPFERRAESITESKPNLPAADSAKQHQAAYEKSLLGQSAAPADDSDFYADELPAKQSTALQSAVSEEVEENLKSSEILTRAALDKVRAQLQSQAELEAEIAKSKADLLKTRQEIAKLQAEVARMQEQALQVARETAEAKLRQQKLELETQQTLNAKAEAMLAQVKNQSAAAALPETELEPNKNPVSQSSVSTLKASEAAAKYGIPASPDEAENADQPKSSTIPESSEPEDKLLRLYAKELQRGDGSVRNADHPAVQSSEPYTKETSVKLQEAALKNTYDAIESMLAEADDTAEPEVIPAADEKAEPVKNFKLPEEPGQEQLTAPRTESAAAQLQTQPETEVEPELDTDTADLRLAKLYAQSLQDSENEAEPAEQLKPEHKPQTAAVQANEPEAEDEPEVKTQSTVAQEPAAAVKSDDAAVEEAAPTTPAAPAAQTAPIPADLDIPAEDPAVKPQTSAPELSKLYKESAQHASQAEAEGELERTQADKAAQKQNPTSAAQADDAAEDIETKADSQKLQQLYTRPAAAEAEDEAIEDEVPAPAQTVRPAVTAADDTKAEIEAEEQAPAQSAKEQSKAAQTTIVLPSPEIDTDELLQPAVVSSGANPEDAQFAARAPESSMPLPEMKEQSAQGSIDPKFRELCQGALGSSGAQSADAVGDANAVLNQTLSAEADAADDAVTLSSPKPGAQNLQSGILDSILSTVPSDDFKDENEILKAEQVKEAQAKEVQAQALQNAAQKRQEMSAPLTAPAAAAVLQGSSDSVPEVTQVKVKQAKEGGFFRKLASLFTGGSKAAQPAVPLMDDSPNTPNVSAGPGYPLQKMMHDLKRALADPSLPPELKQQGADFMHKLNQPVNDLTTVQSWLNFVVSPFTPNTSQALALHQWAFMILCIRFSQLGRDITAYLDKCKRDDPKLASSIEKAVSAAGRGGSTSVTALIDDTFAQTQRLQQLAVQGGVMLFLNNYVPLPPQYEGGSEGGFNLRQDTDADDKDIWHLNFFFDLKDLGPIQIKAEAKLPELFLHIVTDNLDALQQVQQMLPLLQQKLQEFGVTTRESNVRLGHVFMPTASFKGEDEEQSVKSPESPVFSVNVQELCMAEHKELKAAALSYDENSGKAPILAAKGSGSRAGEITEMAKELGIYIHQDEQLLNELQRLREGEEVPQQLFGIIATILAFSYVLQGKTPEGWPRPDGSRAINTKA